MCCVTHEHTYDEMVQCNLHQIVLIVMCDVAHDHTLDEASKSSMLGTCPTKKKDLDHDQYHSAFNVGRFIILIQKTATPLKAINNYGSTLRYYHKVL